ncbi:MAG: DegV family EDD domain-containing protein, partial [Eubacterium sp.]|nr:DegV family EDD domain-containing protein [Eubacterium sp.]
MADFVLSCSSSADLSDVYMKQRDIVYVSHTISLNDVDYKDDMWQSMRPEEMYERMLAGEVSKTSQISVGEYIDHFTKILEEGKDIIHFSLSSGISGTVNAAMNAKMELEDKYPDRKIYVVDSLAASSGFGLFVDKMADLRDEGKSID